MSGSRKELEKKLTPTLKIVSQPTLKIAGIPDHIFHEYESVDQAESIYNLLQEELDVVVDSIDDVIEGVQETIIEDVLQEVQDHDLSLSGSFSGSFYGDGRYIKNVRWENIVGKRHRPGGGGATVIQQIVGSRETAVTFLDTQPGLLILRNQLSALEEPEPEARKKINFSQYTQARISVHVERAGSPSASVGYQFSTDNGTTWEFLDGIDGPIATLASTGSQSSNYVDLVISAQDDILIRWIAQGGDGIADPRISTLVLSRR